MNQGQNPLCGADPQVSIVPLIKDLWPIDDLADRIEEGIENRVEDEECDQQHGRNRTDPEPESPKLGAPFGDEGPCEQEVIRDAEDVEPAGHFLGHEALRDRRTEDIRADGHHDGRVKEEATLPSQPGLEQQKRTPAGEHGSRLRAVPRISRRVARL